jgi:hypothetical protein
MRVKRQRLPPRVKDTEHSAPSGKCAVVFEKRTKRFPRRMKQEIVTFFLMFQKQTVQHVGHRENDMKIRHVHQGIALFFNPSFSLIALTNRTISVSARIVQHVKTSAIFAHVHMSAELGSPAFLNRSENVLRMKINLSRNVRHIFFYNIRKFHFLPE